MRPGLLFAPRDGTEPPVGAHDGDARVLAEQAADDLGLSAVVEAMAGGDDVVADAVRTVLLRPPPGLADVAHRHGVLQDCMREPELVDGLYRLARRASAAQRDAARATLSSSPTSLLSESVATLTACLGLLGELRELTGRYRDRVLSAGLVQLVATTGEELDEGYLRSTAALLLKLRAEGDLLVSARLGRGGDSVGFTVHEATQKARGFLRRSPSGPVRAAGWRVVDGDEAGHRALQSVCDQALADLAGVAMRCVTHVMAYFAALQLEVSFFLGCLTLRHELRERGAAVCLPTLEASPRPVLTARGLYDPGLRLRTDYPVVANDLDADGAALVMLTGANRGGKSTFLRAVGLAQLMAAAGAPVAAVSFTTGVRARVHTHFTRDEDRSRTSGKLDEELRRMSRIADVIVPGDMLLLNESFQSSNEREGSEIARQVVDALTAAGVTVVFATHLHELAHACWEDRERYPATFLRAQRRSGDRSSFLLYPAAPEGPGHGRDLWRAASEGAAEQARPGTGG